MRLIKQKLSLLLLIMPLLASLPFTAIALESDVDKPIEVEADSVEIDEGKNTSTYKGNVVLTQGSIKLTADRVSVIQHENKSNQVKAFGNPARITQQASGSKKPVTGRGSRIEYDVDSDLMYLIGNAVLTQDSDTFKSDRIAYDRKKSLIKGGTSAKGSQRVKVTIKSKKKNEE